MQIGELARATGVPTKTIRYYEEIGVLPAPPRADNGYRSYPPEMVDRLTFVKDAQETGLTLSEIGYILDLRSKGVGTCHHVVELLERHLADLDKHIRTLRATRKQLQGLTERAAALDPSGCTDPNRCQTISPDPGVRIKPRLRAAHVHSGPQPHEHH
ncbi:MAG: hypothetical protein A2Z12_10220 [Actinobacteria bacterium RBG_16_68_21]|nr:MAG: hypothetical protein A2Z12_10220 [Actinobacteria bacterium RBG_16_68_21]